MRVFITFFIYSITISFIFSQESVIRPLDTSAVYKIVEEMPQFPGCESLPNREEKRDCTTKKVVAFFNSNFKYPPESEITGTIIVAFTVEKDGSLTDFEVMRDLGGGVKEEALRVVKLMPNFIAGKQRGYLVKVRLNYPIRIYLK